MFSGCFQVCHTASENPSCKPRRQQEPITRHRRNGGSNSHRAFSGTINSADCHLSSSKGTIHHKWARPLRDEVRPPSAPGLRRKVGLQAYTYQLQSGPRTMPTGGKLSNKIWLATRGAAKHVEPNSPAYKHRLPQRESYINLVERRCISCGHFTLSYASTTRRNVPDKSFVLQPL